MNKTLLLGFLVAGCASTAPPEGVVPVSQISLVNAQGTQVGSVSAFTASGGIRFTGNIRSLPAGQHGFHIHAVGKCEPPFESAGGHFNPTARQHGFDNPNGAHLGDLPNLTVNTRGEAAFDVLARGVELTGPNGLLDADGAALIIHAGPDDMRTDPSGNSGNRIVCGVIAGT